MRPQAEASERAARQAEEPAGPRQTGAAEEGAEELRRRGHPPAQHGQAQTNRGRRPVLQLAHALAGEHVGELAGEVVED